MTTKIAGVLRKLPIAPRQSRNEVVAALRNLCVTPRFSRGHTRSRSTQHNEFRPPEIHPSSIG